MLTKFIFILLLVLSANLISFGQKDTIIYYGMDEQFNKIITSKESAFSYRKITFNKVTKKYNYVEEYLNMTDIPPFERGELISISPEIKDGIIINHDNFGNKIHKRFENNKFICVQTALISTEKLLNQFIHQRI